MSESISRQAAISIPPMPKEHRDYQTNNLDDAYESGWYDLQECIEQLPSADSNAIQRIQRVGSVDLISRQAAIDAMWKSLYAYEDLTEKQFMGHEELELGDWFKHRIFVQRMHEECMKAVESLPSAEPEMKTCEGCKHNGLWEDELYYGVSCPCLFCKRRVNDEYERFDQQTGGAEEVK